jgi:transcriptional regulator with XRE-family HTH domain
MKNRKELGAFLESKRVAAGLTQRNIAKALGYSTPQFVSNWERGQSRPPLNKISKIAKLIGVDPNELFELVLEATVSEVTKGIKKKFNK